MAVINSYIEDYRPLDYADTETSLCIVDCSLGVSPRRLPAQVLESIKGISESMVKNYPHNTQILDLLVKHFAPVADLSAENICLGDGSLGLLRSLNLMYAGAGKKVLGQAPQFAAYVDNARCIGSQYTSYRLPSEDNYRFDAGEFIKCIRNEHPSLICIENPNNPTGQPVPPERQEDIIRAADEAGAAIIFDEAYADYLPLKDSAARFVPKYSHLYIARSFSKGYGMAGIRIGYAIGPKEGIRHLKKVAIPFNCSGPAREIAASMLTVPDYIKDLAEYTKKLDTIFREGLDAHGMEPYKVAYTVPATPINLVYVEDKQTDLCRLLAEHGVAAVSGLSYEGLGCNFVRIMLPGEEKIHLLIERMRAAAGHFRSKHTADQNI